MEYLGMILEMPAGKHEWKIKWKNKEGGEVSLQRDGHRANRKFPTENLKVDKQYVEPDPEQEKRAAEDQKKMKAIYDTVTPERLWDGAFHFH